ncbi:cell division initiation protein [Streptomyces albireticuli]|uniref:Cell division initiation protein n=1 Tax=Streptomyces albireticuli TaxID=1940 RepID=A0A2A2DAG2_9ACTN|nr:cell division initiation protein [Streptomyces albireticuli]MCD9144102.1 cell division initiation protein [Streptomyces albireticuli]MCD9162255.1 cell division initiation protein [Streptomyces albireticuli]MCD9195576.1 cell division initiation protein [Streptomyces albireticuli]PAU48461.1 cell division initiation protein [Streptomyces albireticuli]
MDVRKKLDEIVATVSGARSMPMSASCVVNRSELLALLAEVRSALPDALARADEIVGGRERMVADAREEAERIIESARAHRGSLISDTEVARQSQDEADRILAAARREAEEIRAEADDYVDSKLANFEVVLTKTLGSIDRGREKLLGRPGAADPDGTLDDVPEPSTDPRVQKERVDAYADARLGAVAAVLAGTLEAVGKGRQKLLGARPADELGAHMAAQERLPAGHRTSDADFLAELAAPTGHAGPAAPAGPAEPEVVSVTSLPAQPDWTGQGGYADPYAPAAHQPDPYAYPSYAPQADPYAPQGGYTQHDPYAWPAQAATDGYAAQGGYVPEPRHQEQQAAHQPPQTHRPQLDETSLFDTSMIDLDQLRRYEQGL